MNDHTRPHEPTTTPETPPALLDLIEYVIENHDGHAIAYHRGVAYPIRFHAPEPATTQKEPHTDDETAPTHAEVDALLLQVQRDKASPYWQGRRDILDAVETYLESLRDWLPEAHTEPPTPEPDDDARDEAVRIIVSSVPDHVIGYRFRYAERAVAALIERGLLAAGRAETTTCAPGCTMTEGHSGTCCICGAGSATCRRGCPSRAKTTTATTEDADLARLAQAATEADLEYQRRLEARLAAVEAALANHPRVCDEHADDSPITCGWKRAVANIEAVLSAAPTDTTKETPC